MQKIISILTLLIMCVSFSSCESISTQDKDYESSLLANSQYDVSLLYNCQWVDHQLDILEFNEDHVLIKDLNDTVSWNLYQEHQIVFYSSGFEFFYDVEELSDSNLVLYGYSKKEDLYKYYYYHKCKK